MDFTNGTRDRPALGPGTGGGAPSAAEGRSLVDWLRVLRDGLPAVIALTILGLLLAIVATSLQPTEYRSEATLVAGSSRGFLEPEWADGLAPVASTVTRLASSKAVLDGAAREYVALAPNPQVAASRRDDVGDFEWLRTHLTARQVADSGIVELSAQAETQRDARDLTRAGATSLKEKIAEGPGSGSDAPAAPRGGSGAPGDETARGIVVRDFETTDEGQVSPTPLRNLVLGGNVGLVLGIVAGLALGARRRRLRRPDEMAAELGIPILASIRASDTADGVPRGLSAARARLQRLGDADDQGTVFLLTGTARPERTAQVGEALARAFASSGRTVLVDADLDGQHATRNLEVDGLPGLGELLDGRATQPGLLRPEQVLVTTVEGDHDDGENGRLEVLPAGERPGNVAASLGAPTLARSFQSLRLRYEFVIVIAPGLDRPEEVIPLSAATDWSVLVTPRGERARTFEAARDLALTDAMAGRVAGAIIVDRR